jgi:hypothetical protein
MTTPTTAEVGHTSKRRRVGASLNVNDNYFKIGGDQYRHDECSCGTALSD